MSERSSPCERCGNLPFYDGHTDWCIEIMELEDEIEVLKAFLRLKFPTFDIDFTNLSEGR